MIQMQVNYIFSFFESLALVDYLIIDYEDNGIHYSFDQHLLLNHDDPGPNGSRIHYKNCVGCRRKLWKIQSKTNTLIPPEVIPFSVTYVDAENGLTNDSILSLSNLPSILTPGPILSENGSKFGPSNTSSLIQNKASGQRKVRPLSEGEKQKIMARYAEHKLQKAAKIQNEARGIYSFISL